MLNRKLSLQSSFFNWLLFSLVFLVLSFSSCLAGQAESRVLRVALYCDAGTSRDVDPLFSKIIDKDPAFKLGLIKGEDIRQGALDNYDLLILPGGTGMGQARSMKESGIEKVKEFVASGKGLLGICAGAYFPIQQNFLNAKFKSPLWKRGMGTVQIEFSELGKKVIKNQDGLIDILYAQGPIVDVNVYPNMPHCEVLAWYRSEMAKNDTPVGIQVNSPAVLLTTYGKGTIITSSPHPERTKELNWMVLTFLHHLADNIRAGKPAEAVVYANESSETNGSDFRLMQTQEREKAVKYMRQMAEIEWVPEKDITWFRPKDGVIFKAGEKYRGLPYTQGGRLTNCEMFAELIQNENGLPIYKGPDAPSLYRGSDCSSSASYAWKQFMPDFPVLKTWDMVPGKECAINPKTGKTEPLFYTVGEYKITATNSTDKIVQDNTAKVICQCYDQMRPGDAIVKRPKGHVRMVTRVDVPNRTVYATEQTGLSPEGKLKSDHQSWRVDFPFTYDQLLEDGYIPVTIKGLPADR